MKFIKKYSDFVNLTNEEKEVSKNQRKKEQIELYLFMRKQKDKFGNRVYSDKKFGMNEFYIQRVIMKQKGVTGIDRGVRIKMACRVRCVQLVKNDT